MPDPKRTSHEHTNLLAEETSPYLLQHQHNPVDWHPWGERAFEIARRENKPIFLSVGYSTCYWCHVMERQCFEVESIASEMNQRMVNIKVDREERPDVDQLYMTAVQVLTRHGGWPMSVFLTPDLRPFYGGTYFPPTDQHGRPGFLTLIRALEDAYKNRRSDVDQSAEQIVDILKQLAEPAAPSTPLRIDDELINRLVRRSTADYDPQNGGFGSAPKFPRETLLELLLIHNRYFQDPKRLAMVTHTLDALAFGGIRDQLGGAFHRYSTDAEWLVPHFEIMLYDNAMLAWCYFEAFQQTHEARYATVARGILDFILREMTSPQGAFYTAFDAEVDAQEGLSYLWTRAEVEATLAEALGTELAAEAKIARFCRVYGLDQGPNFSDPHQSGGRPEKNILYLAEPERGNAVLDAELKSLREILYTERKQRKQPLLDTKIITSWNALMIRAFAFAGQILNEPLYLSAATKAASFLLAKHRMDDGGLYRTSRDGRAKYAGFLDDYAFLIQALLALHESGGGEKWKEAASDLSKTMICKFGDPHDRGFYFTEEGAADLIVRQKVASDSPLPSGNAVAAMALLTLEPDLARNTIAAFAGQLASQSESMSAMLEAATLYLRQHPSFVVSGEQDASKLNRPASPKETAGELISMTTAWVSPQILNVAIHVATGFHVNGNQASAGMTPTQLSITGDQSPVIAGIEYPPAEHRQFEFADESIEVFADDFTIVVRFSEPLAAGSVIHLALKYQACDHNSCYLPTTKSVDVAAHHA